MQTMRSRLDTIAQFSTEISTINNVALQNLKNTKIQTDNYWLFMSDFFDIIWNSWLFSWLENLDLLPKKWKKLCVVISCDTGFCLSLNKKLFSKVEKYVDADSDLFCIWKKSFNYFLDLWFNVVWCVNGCKKSADLEILNQYLSNSVNLNIYSEVVVFFNSNKWVSKFNLYSFLVDQLQWFMESFGIRCDFDKQKNVEYMMDEVSLKKIMMVQLSQYIVYWAWLSTKNAEYLHCRSISKMVAQNGFVKKCILSFNQNRQTLLTQKVLELMSKECSMS